MLTKNDARLFLNPLVITHVAKTATSYTAQAYCDEPGTRAIHGIQVDLQPYQGLVVELSKEWCAVKTGDNTFFVAACHLLDQIPEIGATVKVTPYARRDFRGRRLDDPTTDNGIAAQTLGISRTISELPIDKASLRNDHLLHMIEQVESSRSPDAVRRLSQVLIDAGALAGPVAYKDPELRDERLVPPTLQFRVDTQKHRGALNILYDVLDDMYVVQLVEPNTAAIVQEVEDVSCDDLAQVVFDLVDDGQWKLAKVEVLKASRRKRKTNNVTDVTDARFTA